MLLRAGNGTPWQRFRGLIDYIVKWTCPQMAEEAAMLSWRKWLWWLYTWRLRNAGGTVGVCMVPQMRSPAEPKDVGPGTVNVAWFGSQLSLSDLPRLLGWQLLPVVREDCAPTCGCVSLRSPLYCLRKLIASFFVGQKVHASSPFRPLYYMNFSWNPRPLPCTAFF